MAFTVIDKFLQRIFKVDSSIAEEERFFLTRQEMDGIESILHDMSSIDSKSSALLTHISIMLAVLGVFLVGENPYFVYVVLIAEFVIYLFIAMALMRCIDIMGLPYRALPESVEALKQTYYSEINLRRGIYHNSLRIVFLLTALLIPVVIFKYA